MRVRTPHWHPHVEGRVTYSKDRGCGGAVESAEYDRPHPRPLLQKLIRAHIFEWDEQEAN